MNKIIRSCWNAHSQQQMPESGHCEHSGSSKMEMEFCPQQEQGKKWEREQEPSWMAAIEGREQSSATSCLDVEHDVVWNTPIHQLESAVLDLLLPSGILNLQLGSWKVLCSLGNS